MKKSALRSDCPISFSLDIFGDKWSLLILRDIMFRGKFSYLEFMQSEEGIASNILATRLTSLEAEEIIFKSVAPKNKSKYIYQLTKKGIDLFPVLLELIKWGAKYYKYTPATPKEILKKGTQDKTILVNEYHKSLKEKL